MKNRTKKILSLLLAVVFVFTGLFTDAFVLKTNAATENYVKVTKSVGAELTDDGGVDVTLTIDVSQKQYNVDVYSKYDIVLLLDASSSMYDYRDDITNAAKSFVKTLKDSGVGSNVRVACVAFNTSDNRVAAFQYMIGSATAPFAGLDQDVTVNNFTTHTGTPIGPAFDEAKKILDTYGREAEDVQKIVILFSDGEAYVQGLAHSGSNTLALNAADKIKAADGTNATVYSINYRTDKTYYNTSRERNRTACYYETMLKVSSENPVYVNNNGETVALTNDDVHSNVAHYTSADAIAIQYDTYYRTTSLEEEGSLEDAFVQVAKDAVKVDKIGSEAVLADELPQFFDVAVDTAENAVLKSATDIYGNDITGLVEAKYDSKGNLNLKLGTKVTDEEGNAKLGDLEAGTYTIVYTAMLDPEVSAEELKAVYGDVNDDLSNLLHIAFDQPAVLTYVRTSETGEVQERGAENGEEIITVTSGIDMSQTDIFLVRFYINDKLVKKQFVKHNGKATAPALAAPEDGREYKITDWDKAFDVVTTSIDVFGYITPYYNVSFVLDGKDFDSVKVLEGEDVEKLPEVTVPGDETDEDGNVTKYSFSGWDKTLEDLTKVEEDIVVKGEITATVITPTPEDPTPTPDDPTPTPDDPTPTPDDPTPTPDDPTPTEPEEPTPTEPEEIIEDPDIPQEDPEEPTPTEPEEIIEDPDIPQDDPVVPQTGDRRGFSIIIAGAATLLSLLALVSKKRK